MRAAVCGDLSDQFANMHRLPKTGQDVLTAQNLVQYQPHHRVGVHRDLILVLVFTVMCSFLWRHKRKKKTIFWNANSHSSINQAECWKQSH